MVKGELLVGFLEDLMSDVQSLQQSLKDFAFYQTEFNTAIAAHTHPVLGATPAVAIPDFAGLTPSFLKSTIGTLKDAIIKTAVSEVEMKLKTTYNWLKPSSPLYILSRYNKTN